MPSLREEIEQAVTQSIAELMGSEGWRMYTGPQQRELVVELGELTGCEHVGLASSGTAALELLLRACRLQSGDEVLLAGYDYPGNFVAIEQAGGRPALVDVADRSWNLCWESLAATYTPQCKVLIASHLHGQLQDIERLHSWCQERGIWLIQDACQALGASIAGQALGRFGDATLLSFGGSKVISAGRGGAWCTNNAQLAQRARLAAGVGSGAYELSELQAALVLAQLPFLDRITACCRAFFAGHHNAVLANVPKAVAPWLEQLHQTAFYQAGWLLPQPLPGAMPVGEFGRGFDGFHRRSSRRCRIALPLLNTEQVVASTITLHYRHALLLA